MSIQPTIPDLGSLIVPFPPGWTFDYQDQCPVEGRGPGTEGAAISFSEVSPHASEEELRSYFDMIVSSTKEMLLAVALDRGTLHREPSLLLEAGGRMIFSAASTVDDRDVPAYFLQYLCVSLVSQHYFTIGGEGSITEATATWDNIMRRATWANAA